MGFCCAKMEYFVNKNREKQKFDSDDIIYYSPQFDEYGLVVHDSGESYIKIDYCPWGGKKLPESKRDLWFDKLEKMGIENPLEVDIPDNFKSDMWWKNK